MIVIVMSITIHQHLSTSEQDTRVTCVKAGDRGAQQDSPS